MLISVRSRPQSHSAAGKIQSLKNPNEQIGNRISEFLACSALPQPPLPARTPTPDLQNIIHTQFIGTFVIHPLETFHISSDNQ